MDTVMLTTVDNPFDPFTEFDKWFQFDEEKGYHSCSLLARYVSPLVNEVGTEEQNLLVSNAIDEIIKADPLNRYKRVIDNGGGVV